MPTLTLTEIVGEPQEWSPKDNPTRKFHSWRVKASDGTTYEINTKVGNEVKLGPDEFMITPGKGDFPPKLKRVQQNNAGGGAKDAYWEAKEKRDIEGVKRMGRAHAQEMALRTLALTPDSTRKFSDDELRRDIKSWTDWFDVDVGGAPADSSLVAGTAHMSASHTGFASDKQKAFFEKLLTERGVEAEPRGTVMLWASSEVPTERVSKAINALKENHPAAVPALLSESEEWARQQSDIPGDETGLNPSPAAVIGDDSDIPF